MFFFGGTSFFSFFNRNVDSKSAQSSDKGFEPGIYAVIWSFSTFPDTVLEIWGHSNGERKFLPSSSLYSGGRRQMINVCHVVPVQGGDMGADVKEVQIDSWWQSGPGRGDGCAISELERRRDGTEEGS